MGSSFLKKNWVKIIFFIIVVIFVIGGVKLLTGGGGIGQGVGDVLGAFANILTGFTSNCFTTQDDCTTGTSEDVCGGLKGCSWKSSTTTGGTASCTNTTGNPVQTGSFLSIKCALGMSLILGLCALIVSTVIGPLVKFLTDKKNENIKNAAQLSGQDEGKLRDQVVKDAKIAAEKAKEDNPDKFNTKAKERALGAIAAAYAAHAEAVESIEKSSNHTAAEKANLLQAAQAERDKNVEDALQKMDADSKDAADAKDAIDKGPRAQAIRQKIMSILNKQM
jgi:hypothetical protein